jgi:hypothetical protein
MREAWEHEHSKDEMNIDLRGLDRHYWNGTEAGLLGCYDVEAQCLCQRPPLRRSVSASAFPRGSRALFMPFPLPPLTPCSTPAFWLLPSFRNSASDGWDLSANGGAQGSTGSRFTCITASSMLSKSRRSNIPSCEGSKRVVKYVQKMNYGLGRTGLGHENKQYCTSQSARDARNPHKATAPHLFVV